jgi:hypothetical protein
MTKRYEDVLKGGAMAPKGTTVDNTPIICRTNARVGVLGNPSDGFFGKTISLSVTNFWAEVSIEESDKIELMRHPLNDPTTFGSLADLHAVSVHEQYVQHTHLLTHSLTHSPHTHTYTHTHTHQHAIARVLPVHS